MVELYCHTSSWHRAEIRTGTLPFIQYQIKEGTINSMFPSPIKIKIN
jgi:hypothetical protein